MGQAKRRGTFEERRAQAIARKHTFISTVPAIGPIDTPRQQRKASMAMARLMAAALVIGLPLNKDCVKERTP